MCGRYWIDDGRDNVELGEIIEQVNRRPAAGPVKTSGEIFPTDVVPVIASSKRLAPEAFAMGWGYGLGDGKRIINARSETAADRPLFRDGMRQRRCAGEPLLRVGAKRRQKDKVRHPAGGQRSVLLRRALPHLGRPARIRHTDPRTRPKHRLHPRPDAGDPAPGAGGGLDESPI